MRPLVSNITLLGCLCILAGQSAEGQQRARANSEKGFFTISLTTPSSEMRGRKSEVTVRVNDRGDSWGDWPRSSVSYSISFRLMEKDVFKDDVIYTDGRYFKSGEGFDFEETYMINLTSKDKTKRSEIYLEVEVTLRAAAGIGVMTDRASTKRSLLRVTRQ